jgi:hypothetical protein
MGCFPDNDAEGTEGKIVSQLKAISTIKASSDLPPRQMPAGSMLHALITGALEAGQGRCVTQLS